MDEKAFDEELSDGSATLSEVVQSSIAHLQANEADLETVVTLIERVERAAKQEMDNLSQKARAATRQSIKDAVAAQAQKIERMRAASKMQVQETQLKVSAQAEMEFRAKSKELLALAEAKQADEAGSAASHERRLQTALAKANFAESERQKAIDKALHLGKKLERATKQAEDVQIEAEDLRERLRLVEAESEQQHQLIQRTVKQELVQVQTQLEAELRSRLEMEELFKRKLNESKKEFAKARDVVNSDEDLRAARRELDARNKELDEIRAKLQVLRLNWPRAYRAASHKHGPVPTASQPHSGTRSDTHIHAHSHAHFIVRRSLEKRKAHRLPCSVCSSSS